MGMSAVPSFNDVRMFDDVRAAIFETQNPDSGRAETDAVEIDTAIGQLVNEAVATDEVADVFKLAGIENPEPSILSDMFLDNLQVNEKLNLRMGVTGSNA